MSRKQRLLWMGGVIMVVVLLDQVSKYTALFLLEGKGVISLLGDTVRFLLAENRGGFLSLGANLSEEMRSIVFLSATSVFLVLFFAYTLMDRSITRLSIIASALIIGGGVGNLIDRTLRSGAVIDFVNMGIGGLRTGIFNVADMAVLFGCILLFVSLKKSEGMGRKG